MSPSVLRLPVIFSVLAAVTTLALKFAAYLYTDSVGLLSDAAESGVNLIAALTAYLSLHYSAKPVDRSHTYGHSKIEYFSSGLEGTLIVAAAAGIAWYAIKRLIAPEPLEGLGVGIVVALAASVVNFIVGMWLLRVGKQHRSIVLEADGHHLMTDVWTSVALVGGLGLVALTGREWLDPLLALAMSANIVRTGLRLVRRSFDGLMDHALPDDEVAVVRRAVEGKLPAGAAFHALRTRQAGAHRFIEFHMLVPGATTVRTAHRQGEAVEDAVRAALPGSEVVIHVEPIEEQGSWQDSELLALERDGDSP